MKGTVKQVKTKKLDNGGTLYSVQIEANGKKWWYSTFDDEAAGIDGKTIDFEYKKTEKNGKEFYNLTEFKIAQSNVNTNGNGGQSANGKSDCWINAVAFVKSGLEGGQIKDMNEARQEFYTTYAFLAQLWNGNTSKAKEFIKEKDDLAEDFLENAQEVDDETPF